MTKQFAFLLVLTIPGLTALLAQTKTPPPQLVFPAKNGKVAFDHAAHAKRETNGCNTCHPVLFPQNAKASLGFKPPHKTAEDRKSSCGSCHRAGGAAFETKGNCGKCHAMPGGKKG